MSTAGKKSFRKDASEAMMGIFKKTEEEKAALENKTDAIENIDVPNVQEEKKPEKRTEQKEEPVKEKNEKGRGVEKKEFSGLNKRAADKLIKKEKKKQNQAKSVYLSTKHIEFIKEISENSGTNFSEALGQIIDFFIDNV